MKLVIYDKTDIAGWVRWTWVIGAFLFKLFRRIDDYKGVETWGDAFDWLCSQKHPIKEIQFWGHGTWGSAIVGLTRLQNVTMGMGLYEADLVKLREKLSADSIFWLRSCGCFGDLRGQDFAVRLSKALGCIVVGHTYIIHFWHSGTRVLHPGKMPDWPLDEGVKNTEKMRWSGMREPATIIFCRANLPKEYLCN
jgi:hypothetical protein